MIRRLKRVVLAAVACGLLALAFTAAPVHADLGGVTADGWARLLRYAGCAFAIAGATTGFGIAGAVAMCAHVLITEG